MIVFICVSVVAWNLHRVCVYNFLVLSTKHTHANISNLKCGMHTSARNDVLTYLLVC